MAATIEKRKLTPPEIAKRYGVDVIKVHSWIKSGELLAINAATKIGDRPRYLVDVEDLEIFERSRMVVPVDPPVLRKKPSTPPGFVRNFR